MKIEFIDKFIIRTPFASIDELENLSKINNIKKEGLGFIKKTFTGNFKLALLYASKNIFDEVSNLIYNNTFSDKIFYSYIKYYIRYCSRSTPFGLFSTYGICDIKNDNDTSFQLKESEVKARINLSYIYELCAEIRNCKNIWNSFFLYSNQTVYRLGNDIRYNELYIENKIINYRLSSIDNNEIHNEILQLGKTGIYFKDLSLIIQKKGYAEDEVNAYLYDLIENNVLMLDIFPSPASNDYVSDFISKLSKIENQTETIILKKDIKTTIGNLKEKILNLKQEISCFDYNDLESLISKKSKEIDIITFRDSDAKINYKLLYNITNTLTSLSYLNYRSREKDPTLKNFVNEFKDKYGEAELPLLHVIDPEIGIFNDRINSISIPLLDGLNFNSNSRGREYNFNSIDEFIFNKYQDALLFNKKEIVITKEECAQFKAHKIQSFNQTLNCSVSIFKDEKGEIKAAIHGAFGSSAINNIGRFTFGSEKLQELVKEIVDIEYLNTDEAIEFAEIIDLPGINHGNLVVRQNYLRSEIPINLATTSLKCKNKISLANITVSIKNEDVILRDRETNKVIIPRLSNSHNFQLQNLSHIYRFLSLVQIQWDNSINFSWGFIDSFAKYKPRVRIEKVIVKEATWNFTQEDLSFIKDKDNNCISHKFKEFKNQWKIPNKIFLVEGDNKLLFDLESEIYLNLFFNIVSKKRNVILVEDITHNKNSLVVSQKNRPFYSELILPVVLKNEKNDRNTNVNFNNKNKVLPQLSPLSKCLYFNIYTGEQQMDSLIKEELFKLNKILFDGNLIENFFFIRYNENGHHLRLRYFLNDYNSYNKLFFYIRETFQKYVTNNLIKKVDICTYDREIERYDYLGINFTEIYFGKESQMIILLLSKLDIIDFKERWLIGIVYVNKLLDKFSYSLEEKTELLFHLSSQFNREFNTNKHLTKIISSKYKDCENIISDSILKKNTHLEDIYLLFDNFLSSVLFEYDLKGKTKADRNNYLGSLIHMFLNRLLISQHRKQELLIYNFMSKFYNTQFKRN